MTAPCPTRLLAQVLTFGTVFGCTAGQGCIKRAVGFVAARSEPVRDRPGWLWDN